MGIPKEQIPSIVPVTAIRRIEQERNGTLGEAKKLQVKSLADSDVANVVLTKLTTATKLINKRFKEILDPQNEAIRQVRGLRTQILTPLEDAKRELTDRLMQWREEERQRIAAERAKVEAENRRLEEERLAEEERRRKIQASHAAKGHDTKPLAPVPELEPIPEPAPLEMQDTTRTRKQWDMEVVDASLVPEEYRLIDEVQIRKDVRSAKGQIEIPGVRVFQKEVPVFA